MSDFEDKAKEVIEAAKNTVKAPKLAKTEKTRKEIIMFTPRQKEIVLGAIDERRFLQEKAKEALKKEGDLVSLVIDSNGFDSETVSGATISEDSNSLIVTLPALKEE